VSSWTVSFKRHSAQPVLVNGAAGLLVAEKGKLFSVMGFTVRHDMVAAIDILADPARLKALGISGTDD
jgi:type IV secretory pathway TrbD component